MASDLAGVFDGSWLRRVSRKLEQFWGPAQSGGVHDALALVACLLLLCQLSFGGTSPLHLAFTDLATAFDAAAHDDLKFAAFLAGVVGSSWMLLDDLLSQDFARIRLAEIVSERFVAGIGTAQGRKLSVHHFNCLMRSLFDLVVARSPGASTLMT